jgi:hypothetical protein
MSFGIGRSPGVFIDQRSAGSACCVWRDGLRTYVLTAAHVVAGLAEGSVIGWRSAVGEPAGFGQTLDPSLYWLAANGGELDAAPVPISVAGPFAMTREYPWANRIMAWNEIPDSLQAIVCGQHGPRFAAFDRRVPPGEPGPSGHSHGRLLRFRLDDIPTMPGDSGCPVIALPEGSLVGLHVGLDRADRRFSFAVAAADVRNAFFFELPGFDLRP